MEKYSGTVIFEANGKKDRQIKKEWKLPSFMRKKN